jgi:hypothetical protein
MAFAGFVLAFGPFLVRPACEGVIRPCRAKPSRSTWRGSDRRLRVGRDATALAVLLAAGVPIEPGCQTGGCGSGVLAFVEGNLIHKDTFLSVADRARHFCPCVSSCQPYRNGALTRQPLCYGHVPVSKVSPTGTDCPFSLRTKAGSFLGLICRTFAAA